MSRSTINPVPSIFSSTPIDSVEIECWSDALSALPVRRRSALGLLTVRYEAGVALMASGIDHPLFNRVFLPHSRPFYESKYRAAGMTELLAVHAAAGVRNHFIHLPKNVGQAGHELLVSAGFYRYSRDWIKLAAPCESLLVMEPFASGGVSIGPITVAQGPAFSRLLAQGFDLPPAAIEVFQGLVGRPRWHLWGARVSGQLVSAAALFVDGSVGYLAAAVTEVAYREHGIHGAMLAVRVAQACRLGCQWLTSETGAPVSGQRQHSQNNMARCGLRQTEVRYNYVTQYGGWGLDPTSQK